MTWELNMTFELLLVNNMDAHLKNNLWNEFTEVQCKTHGRELQGEESMKQIPQIEKHSKINCNHYSESFTQVDNFIMMPLLTFHSCATIFVLT